jgi:hypothetical protein
MSAEFEAEVTELAIAERASVELAARVRAADSGSLVVHLVGGTVLRGTLADVTPSWMLLHEGKREHLVPLTAIAGLVGITDRSLPVGEVERRLTLGHALRILAAAKARVVAETAGGIFRGTIAAVGADHFDVLLESGMDRVAIPFAALARVTSA